ncbi:tetratricopeptide repeat protein [Myxococcus stipitatus]|uniref:tetratricopeptide repeat protein n=1 Tax=Myxococcus stipitatus TaxID=83455 RepID=UPI001F1748DD|nr:tetratricopeptide repeat protein [Myxococcus stipitatus]MCE9668519.1 tetratricopeptide repeat protein [Myxococcus stipitatus]
MNEREQARLKELKDAAQTLFGQGRYAQCAELYANILRLVPKDPNLHMRHAESCRRAGSAVAAIGSYRAAARLLLALGHSSRARAALRAALAVSPKDPTLLAELEQLEQMVVQPSTALEDERLYSHAAGFFALTQADGARGRHDTPPPPPPAFVLRAAEETRATGPLPAAPTIPPVSLDMLRQRNGSPTRAPLPPDAATPSVTRPPPRSPPSMSSIPVVMGVEIPSTTQPAVANPTLPTSVKQRAEPPHPRTPPTLLPVPANHGVSREPPAEVAPNDTFPVATIPADGARTPVRVAIPVSAWPQRASLTVPPTTTLRPELLRLAPNVVAIRVSPQSRWVIFRSDSPLEVLRSATLPGTESEESRNDRPTLGHDVWPN